MRSSDAASVVAGPARYRSLLRNTEYVGLLTSRGISVVGDQVARVALTVLVFDRTDSPFFAAVALGATIVPGAFAPLIAGIADRWPRRRVLIAGDLLRAALLGLMVAPGDPWGLLTLLVALVTLVEGPHDAARMPLLRTVLMSDDAFRSGTAIDEMTEQPGQILGFLLAGALLAVADPRVALLVDAASFLASALIVRLLVQHRHGTVEWRDPVASNGLKAVAFRAAADARVGFAAAFAPRRRRPLLLCWIAASAALAPDVLVASWARQIHAGSFGIGLLLAAPSIAVFVALPLVGRVAGPRADRVMIGLVVVTLLPLTCCALRPGLPVALVLVACCGAGTTFTVLSRVGFMTGMSDDVIGRAYSVASGGLCAGQGICIIAAGSFADAFGAGQAIAIVAVAGLVLSGCVVIATRDREAARPDDTLSVESDPIPDGAEKVAFLDLADRGRAGALDTRPGKDRSIASLR